MAATKVKNQVFPTIWDTEIKDLADYVSIEINETQGIEILRNREKNWSIEMHSGQSIFFETEKHRM